MSIVVAVRKGSQIVMAADTQTNFGSNSVPSDNHKAYKIRRVGSAYLASTGPGLYENILDDVLAKKRSPVLSGKASIFRFFMQLWKRLHSKYSLVNDQCAQDENSPFGDLDASFLVANRRGIFYVASDMSITEFNKYFAVGSGTDFSLGLLYGLYDSDLDAEELATRAIKAAMDFSVYCGGEITKVRIRLPRSRR